MTARLQETVPYRTGDDKPNDLAVSYTDPAQVAGGRPPVVMVHGLWTDMGIWESRPPATLPVPQEGTHPVPPIQLLPRLAQAEAPWEDPRGLWETVEQAGFAGVSWSQRDSRGNLPGGTDRELAAVVDFALRTYQAQQVLLVAHSRGGLVCRAYLMDPDAAPKVAALVTIGTPHWGTRVSALPGQVEGQVANTILSYFGLPGKLIGLVATSFVTRLINDLAAGFSADFDLLAWKAPYNSRLQTILTRSVYGHIHYVAIAGAYPHIDDARLYHYTPASFVPHGFPPRFHWQEATYPPAGEPPVQMPLLLGTVGTQLGLGELTTMPELYPDDGRRPEGGDGAVAKHSAWFGDPLSDRAQGYVKNLKFPYGHNLLARRPEVHAAILAELAAACGD